MRSPEKLRLPAPAEDIGRVDMLRHMVDAVQDYAIYMLDLDGNVMTWNSGAERNKGYKASEIIGRNYACFFPPEAIAQGRPHKELREARKRGPSSNSGLRSASRRCTLPRRCATMAAAVSSPASSSRPRRRRRGTI